MFFAAEVEGLPEPGRYGVGVFFLPHDDGRRAELEELVERTVADEGQRFLCWRDVPVDSSQAGTASAGVAPRIRQAVIGAADGLERRRVRAQALRDPARRRARGRAGPRRAEPLVAHARLQGDADRAAARALLPRSRRPARRDGARARPLPLLDEHVPELGARAPVPLRRAQRRDQHAARQRQLDARARVAARVGALRRRPREGAAGDPARRLRHRRRSTTCSSCSCSPAARCRTR